MFLSRTSKRFSLDTTRKLSMTIYKYFFVLEVGSRSSTTSRFSSHKYEKKHYDAQSLNLKTQIPIVNLNYLCLQSWDEKAWELCEIPSHFLCMNTLEPPTYIHIFTVGEMHYMSNECNLNFWFNWERYDPNLQDIHFLWQLSDVHPIIILANS